MWQMALIIVHVIILTQEVLLSLIYQLAIVLAPFRVRLFNDSYFILPVLRSWVFHLSEIPSLLATDFRNIFPLLSQHLLCPDVICIITNLRHDELLFEYFVHLPVNFGVLAVRSLFQ